jgi:CMP-N,N'-diacetyllegionaminic acid synthase
MIGRESILAIVPARGGSKRLPQKNKLFLAGKPLLLWTLDAAKQSRYIDRIIVSSDDDQIIDHATKEGVGVIKRPKKYSSDTASSYDVVSHALKKSEEKYDYIILLQPTSPLRTGADIDNAILLLEMKNADAVISVTESDHSPLWQNTLPENGDMSQFLRQEVLNIRSQDLPTYYRLNGAVYICRRTRLLEEKTFFLKDNIYSFIMPQHHSIDIDAKYDFMMAELLLKDQN